MMDGPGSQGFPREHRLTRRSEFVRVYEGGERAHGRYMVLFCYPRPEGGPWRLGLTATRKIGGAVVRNRLRRRGREAFRRRGGCLPPGCDFVINFKRAAIEADHREFEAELDRLLRHLGFDQRCQQS